MRQIRANNSKIGVRNVIIFLTITSNFVLSLIMLDVHYELHSFMLYLFQCVIIRLTVLSNRPESTVYCLLALHAYYTYIPSQAK